MAAFPDHDAYIAAAAAPFRPALAHLRSLLAAALPGAAEVIRYGQPGFEIGGKTIAGYAAFSRQCGLYLAPGAIAAHRDDIAAAGLKATKTGITFAPKKPIPDALVTRLAQESRRDLGL